MRIAVIIVAAGHGARFGSERPKQYHDLLGQPVLRRTVLEFLRHKRIDTVLAVIAAPHRAWYDQAVSGLDLPPPVAGAEDRQGSVLAGLEALEDDPPDAVLIHDAARPLVSASIVDAVIDALATTPAALPAVPVTDSLKRVVEGRIEAAVDRSHLVGAQTPQGFVFADILKAHRQAVGAGLTDDTAVASAAGMRVAVVPGSADNLKITTKEDLERAAMILRANQRNVSGLGFDVHAFAPSRRLWLCGLEIPHDRGLAGHSDADVGLHAITDAVLGSISDGDIGSHFPPSDPQWRDAASDQFLRHAVDRVAARGGVIEQVDLVLICEEPKIGPHRDAMRKRVAGIMLLPAGHVSIKATTSERLGFAGRKEGIAAQAVVSVSLPR